MMEFFNATVIPSTIAVAFFVAAYLLGSVSFAVIVSKLYGLQDPRSYGSGNPGATNVLRSGHKTAAVLTLLGDAFKGWLAVWLTINLGASATLVCIAAVGVFIGHLFPIFLAFKGGKGVATAFGVLLALAPALGLATLLTWLIVAFFFRMSSLAAVAAGVFAPFYYLILAGVLWPFEPAILGALILIGVLLLARHRANIVRILAGTEPKIGKKTT
jgi:acyl phosphate:glycerol-3-phosphate acyltransferase